jgi:hypothetical protein
MNSVSYLDRVTLTNELGNFSFGQVATRLFERSLKIWKTPETNPILFVRNVTTGDRTDLAAGLSLYKWHVLKHSINIASF